LVSFVSSVIFREMNFLFRSLTFLFLPLFLSACSTQSTKTELNLEDYIWNTLEKIEQENSSNSGDGAKYFFAEQNFPNKCRWETLNRVVDGDTVIVGRDERVRFIGIDTPEIKHPNKPLDPRGLVSSDYLKDLIGDSKKICLIEDTIGDKIDKYDRTLAYLFTEEGTDLNADLVKSGWAKGYFYFAFDRKHEFRSYESIARSKKIGLWE
jgi:micrococcal nuclease